tara:strand:+ start:35 stop:208 length:174 start_codon:yes stop_codon:yes gene_type:complete
VASLGIMEKSLGKERSNPMTQFVFCIPPDKRIEIKKANLKKKILDGLCSRAIGNGKL